MTGRRPHQRPIVSSSAAALRVAGRADLGHDVQGPVLCALGSDGPLPSTSASRAMRYSELSRRIAGVSQKRLTQTLRSLERDGLVTRTVTPTVPVTVTYELTDLGLSLHRTVRGLKRWAEAHMDDVLAHRGTYDEIRTPEARDSEMADVQQTSVVASTKLSIKKSGDREGRG